ncbi:MAG: hypothetical protein M1826_003065 [Phylliscum demangeonii]|nr:MAG: hypothetical protein M1826_003065 [Phylliscum demangeonii]
MDDADDALNDDTFGDLDTGAATHASVGKDFDFYGQTARVSEAINEEQLRYSRQPPPQKASGAMMDESTRSSSKPVRTGYEKYKDPGAIPDLRVHASLWDVEPKHAEVEAQRAYQEPSAVDFAAAPPARKMMSLEEVEAAMLARNKKQTISRIHAKHSRCMQYQTELDRYRLLEPSPTKVLLRRSRCFTNLHL